MSLLQMSFSGGVMILAVIVVRMFTINRLPKKVFSLLWGAVLLRLLIPFSVPTMFSAYSLMSRNEPIQAALSDTPVEYMIPQMAAVPTDVNVSAAEVMPDRVLPVSGWMLLWIAGVALCAAYFSISYMRGLLEFRTSLPVSNEFADRFLADHRLRRGIQIRQSDRISAPLTYGILRPVILMPKKTDWEDEQQLQYVLSHEFVHIRRLDMVWKLISALALCIHWFNPLVWAMYILFNRDIELSCDESVVRSYGESSKSVYAMTLLTMEEKKSGLMPLCNNFSKNAIEERITAIMKIKRITLWAVIMSTAVFAAVVVLFATTAEGKPLSDADDAQTDTNGAFEDVFANFSMEDINSMPDVSSDGVSYDATIRNYTREEKTVLQYDLAGSREELPVTLYVGEGFSIYIPDQGWNIYDETLEPPHLMAAVYSSYVSIGVAHYAEEKVEDVIEGLLSDGYTYDAYTGKYQRFDGSPDELILEESRIYGQDNDVWRIDSRYLAEVEFGGRLDAIADTFAVTVNGEQGSLPAAVGQEASVGDVSKELEGMMTTFYQAYFTGDVDTIRGLVIKDYIWSLDVYGDPAHADEVEILKLKGPQAVIVQDYSDGYDMSLEFRIPGEDSLTYLSATWVKEDDIWKIKGYGLEK